ncbi:hypothetical protein [Chryseobacterium koreense]|uniref:Lipopolysaccharide core biosynthesis protein rfaS n=1 Tax=Chryseobacterium koreense CCUG 49689 TaxID=1304281 RepID=A0A0J7IZ22_9FLAO|nr:hypothetical protein [Chryseobacterium koreense]KMQ71049.1 lipopolysaccharide core biosynthesis protein rfaS [Chryseobacterium koreense CCUG 49689]MBB5332865.1 hypothetical protein [Chryseobacterium koreense]
MKNTILFIAPDYYGFNEVVFEGLLKYSGQKVFHLNSTLSYQYSNFKERLQNFFMKTFQKRNLKIEKKGLHVKQIIESTNFDLLIVNRPDVLANENLNLAIKKSRHSILLLWDSLEKIPQIQDYIGKFDVCYSFDSLDCERYGFKFIPNFYFVKSYKNLIKFDVCYLATYDQRISGAIDFFRRFKEQNIVAKGRIFTYKSNPVKETLPETIKVINKIIPFSQSYKYYLDSKAILDIAHPNQRGLSFRPYEAIGLKKKLITTNREILNSDFYDPQNILLVESISDFTIPQDFFLSPYRDLPNEIQEKYYIKNWVKNLISTYES